MAMFPPLLVAADLTKLRPGVEETLQVKGVNTVPNQADMGAVSMVMDVGQGGFGVCTYEMLTSVTPVAIGGLTGGSIILIGPQGFTFAGVLGNAGASLNQENARLIASSCNLNFDAAGLAAMAGITVRVTWDIRDFDNTPNFQAWARNFVPGALTERTHLDSGFWAGLIPYNVACSISVGRQDGGNFPANTTFGFNGGLIAKRKSGGQIPR
jgi:hypothetical protein